MKLMVRRCTFVEEKKISQKFSTQGLLGKEICSSSFINGTLVIFRLAPRDYHRFHFSISGTTEHFVDVPGCLYTVCAIIIC
ncbi:hypothetical protein VitviT2T_010172 [Vitis vinifera]|uniref:ZP domain-containing protein n=2 Tax=Vitis vinifera TaxID=29760 RepID=D7SRP5_VITVI